MSLDCSWAGHKASRPYGRQEVSCVVRWGLAGQSVRLQASPFALMLEMADVMKREADASPRLDFLGSETFQLAGMSYLLPSD